MNVRPHGLAGPLQSCTWLQPSRYYGVDGFYYDHFGGYYDKWGYQFKDGSYKSRCGYRYDATTGKFLDSKGTEFSTPDDVRAGSLDDKRDYVQMECAALEQVLKYDAAHKARK